MTHDFTIGKPTVEPDNLIDGPVLLPVVEPVTTPAGVDPVHTDEYEGEYDAASGRRSPSFRAWSEVINADPAFLNFWYDIREYATERYEPAYIPVEVYADRLDEIEDTACSLLDSEETEPLAQRMLWFVRWSRYAHEQYGEMAAFQNSEPLAFRRR